MKPYVKIIFYLIMGFTPVAFIVVFCALIGVIIPPPSCKAYYIEDQYIDFLRQRLVSFPSQKLNMKDYEDNNDLPRYWSKESQGRIYYSSWPLDSVTFASFELQGDKQCICLFHFRTWDGEKSSIVDINDRGTLFNQIRLTLKFEDYVLKGTDYKCETTLLQDCFHHFNRRFVELCTWWPLIALFVALIYWAYIINTKEEE